MSRISASIRSKIAMIFFSSAPPVTIIWASRSRQASRSCRSTVVGSRARLGSAVEIVSPVGRERPQSATAVRCADILSWLVPEGRIEGFRGWILWATSLAGAMESRAIFRCLFPRAHSGNGQAWEGLRRAATILGVLSRFRRSGAPCAGLLPPLTDRPTYVRKAASEHSRAAIG